MKAINKIFICLVLTALVIYSCDDEDFAGDNVYSGYSFVRFHLVLDGDSVPLEGGFNEYGRQTVDAYNHKLIKPGKIPVVLTSANELDGEITVDYTTSKTGDFTGYTQSPIGQLTFSRNKLIDTIIIDISERWDTSQVNQLQFELTDVSDPSVQIGSLNDYMPNNKLTFSFGKLTTTCTMPLNRIEIEGLAGESFDFDVDFPKGLFVSEVDGMNLFVSNDGFDYTLTQHPLKKGDTKVTYTLTLDENINNDDVYFESTLSLIEDLAYVPQGNKTLQIVKPIKVDRDKSTFPASNFYNLNDPYYRTYLEMWYYDEGDAVSEWKSSSQFTYPVVVGADDPNGVLYSDRGTPDDTSDDIYHHAYKLKFDSPNAGRTTNAFAMKSIFNNEYTDADKSPGFNIAEALEFYPKDGNNPNEGNVLVISQFLTISSKEDKSYTIGIKGSGTYHKVSEGLWEIVLTVKFTNDELWGGTQEVHYHMYNSRSYQDPDLLDVKGVTPVDL
ncbi:hypothetical protein [Carboxylicivirga sp. RSCT41]|uniref:hypothetical protein n=1 Tax=Carboxylicivirga agarovorans TaxID=3417570 RepID=UPI003D32C649